MATTNSKVISMGGFTPERGVVSVTITSIVAGM